MDPTPTLIFAVDDEPMTLELLKFGLSDLPNCKVEGFTTGEGCLEELDREPAIIVLDYYLNADDPEKLNGMDVLKRVKELRPQTQVIILSGQEENAKLVFDFVAKGATHYIIKDAEGLKNLKETIEDILKEL